MQAEVMMSFEAVAVMTSLKVEVVTISSLVMGELMRSAGMVALTELTAEGATTLC
jgi:hypothetical protein